ncbi:methyl-accepting chemotaxis protein [Deltaproteobacteria bacterium TL4]
MKISIRWKIMLLGFSIALFALTVPAIYVFWVIEAQAEKEVASYENEIMDAKTQELKNMVSVALSAVERVYAGINNENQLKKQTKDLLNPNLELVLSMIHDRYQQAASSKNPQVEMKKAQKELLLQIGKLRYGPSSQRHFWIHSFDRGKIGQPQMLMHPVLSELEGQDVSEYRFSIGTKKGKLVYSESTAELKTPLFVQINQNIAQTEESFVRYEWPLLMPNGMIINKKMLGYAKVFKPWGWVIGTELFLSELEEDAQKTAIQILKELRYGKQQEYFWIYASNPRQPDEGTMLMHSVLPALEGVHIKDLRYLEGAHNGELVYAEGLTKKMPLLLQANRLISEFGEGVLHYQWPKPRKDHLDAEYVTKLMYAKPFKKWNWVIATGTYLDELGVAKQAKQTMLNQHIQKVIVGIFAFSIVSILICVSVMFFFSKAITNTIYALGVVFKNVKDGDFTKRVHIPTKDEIAYLGNLFNALIDRLSDVIGKVKQGATSISSASSQLAERNQNLASRTEEHSAALEETSATMEEITVTVQHNANSANEANQISKSTKTAAELGSFQLKEIVTKTISANRSIIVDVQHTNQQFVEKVQTINRDALVAMEDITSSAKKISGIISVINEIAFQTNLLALNASVEAARAGEHGKGFAVVAAEVRKLAHRSSKASKVIGELIESSLEQVSKGTQLANESNQAVEELSGKTKEMLSNLGENLEQNFQDLGTQVEENLQGIINAVTEVSDMIENISVSSREQADGIKEINYALSEMGKLTQQNATLIEEIAAASQMTADQGQELMELMNFFNIEDPAKGTEKPAQISDETLFIAQMDS